MKQYFLIGFLGFFLLILLVAVFFLLWSFKSNIDFTPQFMQDNKIQAISTNNNPTWQEEVANWVSKDYTPAAEQFSMHFEADISDFKEKSKYYQLIINKYDIYSIFCLKQTLNFFNIDYFLLKSNDNPEIFLNTDNKTLIENIINKLKEYKINAKAKEIWL
ncbi:hypothetical protein JG677_07405 [Campylobacter sp. TTU-622]|uniref:hypothetical protein n=1 Tax=unclassified Campylobacter TaxID=2593542 RepID=UPI0019059395|nr:MULTISPECIES: hypothetical protein [unclassified Campylobacter]MBK1973870.1 hypothetical protein [Campylobacter sp. TTU-622]MBK1991937.1 hypothetical protein [Campylobacter sp. 2018MI34]